MLAASLYAAPKNISQNISNVVNDLRFEDKDKDL